MLSSLLGRAAAGWFAECWLADGWLAGLLPSERQSRDEPLAPTVMAAVLSLPLSLLLLQSLVSEESGAAAAGDASDGVSAAVWQQRSSARAVGRLEEELRTQVEEMREAFQGLMSVFEQASGEGESILDFLLDMFSDRGRSFKSADATRSPAGKGSPRLAQRRAEAEDEEEERASALVNPMSLSARDMFSRLW